MANENWLIDVNAIPESATTISTDGRLFVAWSEIVKAPTVDTVEVVHGRWIAEHEESIRCSECCFNRANIKIPMDYCPNCGAKMDGDVNG